MAQEHELRVTIGRSPVLISISALLVTRRSGRRQQQPTPSTVSTG